MTDKAKRKSAAPRRKPVSDAAKRHQEETLDEALDETFPASDPVELTPKRK